MRKILLTGFLAIGIFTLFGTAAAKAQTGILGKYMLVQKLINGQKNQISFELKKDYVAVYSKVNPALEESAEKIGSWKFNASKKLLTVTILPAEDNDREVIITFKLNGKNLKVVSVSPKDSGRVGDVFRKL